MAGLSAQIALLPPRDIGTGQRALWRAWDAGLLGLAIMAMADMPNRWSGMLSLFWLVIYALTLARVLLLWPAFFRLASRNWTLLLYPAVCLLSVVWSGSRGTTLASGVQVTMSFTIALFLGWRFTPRQLILTLCTIISAAAVLGLANWLTGVLQPVYSNVGGLLGIYTSKNMLGHYSQTAALLALTIALMPPGEAPWLMRRAAPLVFVLCVTAVLLSKSMTAVLLLPCYAALLFVLNRKRLPAALCYGTIAVLVLAIGLGPLALAMLGIDPVAEVFRATGKDTTLTGRTELWSLAARLSSAVPLTGYGFGAFWAMGRFDTEHFLVLQAGATAPSFHNFIADIMVGTGLAGLLAMFAMLGTALSRAIRAHRAAGTAVTAACVVTTLLPINVGMLEPYIYRQHEFMMMWVVMLAVSIGEHLPLTQPTIRRAPSGRPPAHSIPFSKVEGS